MTGLRWGILATGGIARTFTADLRAAGLDVIAVGSRSLASAQSFADTFDIPRRYRSYRDLVGDPDVDVIYIATPHSLHAEHARLALEAGKHVLVEKSFTLTQAQAAELRDLAAARGLFLMEAMWTRYLPHMARIRQLVRSGALGQVHGLRADHTGVAPTDPDHRLNNLALGGGGLLDIGVYSVSFAFDMLGAPIDVRATGILGETGVDTEVATAMTHVGGAVSTTLTSLRAAGLNAAAIHGSEASIVIDRSWLTPTTFRVIAGDGRVVEIYDRPVEGRGMQYEALAVERYIAEGRTESELEPLDETVAIMGTLDEIRRQIGLRYPGVDD
ncbi:putative dehydrogenase [Acidipropionibacterium acidipropionici ATCC 4875]|uniref:Putative dehydrogenase n=1 Tax=Acidipropionibacterium acidipropionici (strain ATCC 4875 / DSM 20272 / JCM 6432 / NBRC 12425 / NCIMB 8070 / 4) TaxID=1171373 RepID=K7RNN3_ACIA4|nr:Gfo/Idh/MocA family oxidoreductase [Acidipropionibacterium acidipropionici]AFV87866.1 putative dehydrogenase [Acidipropionibacterium acidipropionici ATCC 4875]